MAIFRNFTLIKRTLYSEEDGLILDVTYGLTILLCCVIAIPLNSLVIFLKTKARSSVANTLFSIQSALFILISLWHLQYVAKFLSSDQHNDRDIGTWEGIVYTIANTVTSNPILLNFLLSETCMLKIRNEFIEIRSWWLIATTVLFNSVSLTILSYKTVCASGQATYMEMVQNVNTMSNTPITEDPMKMTHYSFLSFFLISSTAFTGYSIFLLQRKPDPSKNGVKSLRRVCKILVFMDFTSLLYICYIIFIGVFMMGTNTAKILQDNGEFMVCLFLFGSCVLGVVEAVVIPGVILYFGYYTRETIISTVRQQIQLGTHNQSITTCRVSPAD
eukprot:sb/3466648/